MDANELGELLDAIIDEDDLFVKGLRIAKRLLEELEKRDLVIINKEE